MPKNTKEEIKEIKEKPVEKAVQTKKVTVANKSVKEFSSKTTAIKKAVNKHVSSGNIYTIKVSTKKMKSTSKKSRTSSKVFNKSTTRKTPSKDKKEKKQTTHGSNAEYPIEVLEYYDLPYRYNQTVVKILAQTPTTLFVYWDISDSDKEHYINQYGTYFFNNTKPVLIIHNKTLHYSFEIEINDFANSWYLHVQDSNCTYQVELGRRPINKYVTLPNNYLHITNSNNYVTQNDHILLDKLSHIVYFKNVKTNEIISKNITNFTLLQKIGKLDIEKFYEKLYPDGLYNFKELHLENPSSKMK